MSKSIYGIFSSLTKDREEQRNLFFFGLSMLFGALAIPFYAGSVGQAFNAKYGITPTILAAMQLPTRIITIAVMLGDEVAGTGVGHSKKEAEQNAARAALEHLEAKMESGS